MPLVRHVRTPTPPRPAALLPYSPPSPIYCPDPTPSPPSTSIVNSEQCSGGSVSISPERPRTRTGASVYKSQSALTPPKSPNASIIARKELKLWEKIQIELPKDLSRFCKEVTENIGTYSDLVDFAVKCDVPITWINRAKEDNPNDSQSAINQVFYEWWDRSHLNLARKLKMIQAAFGYMGKPAIFNRIVYTCPDVEMLLDHAVLTRLPNLIGGKHGKTGTNPAKTYLFRMARVRTAFNACGFLTYCDEVLVTLGHRISAINDFARVNSPPPNECPSAESCSGSGDNSDSPRKRRDSRNSAEISDDEQRQPPNIVASTSKENDCTPQTPPNSSNKTSNTNSPTAVFELEDTQNDIELSDENVQGIVTLRMERNAVKGKTQKEVLERLMPKVLLKDINKENNNK